MKRPFLKYSFIVIFLFIISLPLLDEVIKILPENVNNEKRELTRSEVFNRANSINFLKDILGTYNDNFNGRSWFINLYIKIKMSIFGRSPLADKVIIGEEGYYYLVNYNCMDDYRNVNPFTEVQLEEFSKQLLINKKYLSGLGIEYFVTVVPDKQRIYPEYLPSYITKVGDVSRLQQLKDYISNNNIQLNLIDLGDTLSLAKSQDLYFKKDSHWNYCGAFVGYAYLMRHLQKRFPYLTVRKESDYRRDFTEEIDLDLAKLLGESFYNSEPTIKLTPLFDTTNTEFDHRLTVNEYIARRKPNYIIAKQNLNANYKLLMFRDSYTTLWADYLINSFGQSVFVWKYAIDKDMVEAIRPDIVIQQVAERHLDLIANTTLLDN